MEIPQFKGAHIAQQVVEWVENHLTYVSGVRSAYNLGRRTPREIIESGAIDFSFGCLDKAAVIATLLRTNGLEVKLNAEIAYHEGKSYALHFSLQTTDNGKEITIDPHTLGTEVIDGWFEDLRPGTLSAISERGKSDVVLRKIQSTECPENSLDLTCFQLAKIDGQIHFFKLGKPHWPTLFRVIAGKIRKKTKRRIMSERKSQEKADL